MATPITNHKGNLNYKIMQYEFIKANIIFQGHTGISIKNFSTQGRLWTA